MAGTCLKSSNVGLNVLKPCKADMAWRVIIGKRKHLGEDRRA